jgi:hypothetical protein
MLTFLLLALVWAASAQTRTVGVTVSNTFKYNTATSWISDDPSATPPSSLVGINSTQWVELSITAISGTNITGQTTTLYKNGTKITEGGWVDVNTGDGENLTVLIISANLAPGDSVYTSSPYNTTLIINETTSRTYQGGARDTNHINVTSASTSSQGNLSLANNIYWDKSTGVLVELSTVESNQTGTYTTKWSEDVQISDSNVWTVPEFPNWTPTLITLIMLTSAIVVIHGQKRPKKPLP